MVGRQRFHEQSLEGLGVSCDAGEPLWMFGITGIQMSDLFILFVIPQIWCSESF